MALPESEDIRYPCIKSGQKLREDTMKLKITLVLLGATLVLAPTAMRAQGDGTTALETLGGEPLTTGVIRFQQNLAAQAAEKQTQKEKACVKKYEAKFYYKGKEVPSKIIGDPDSCETYGGCAPFGGNLVYTPNDKLYVYVGVNIPVSIDLDMVEQAFENNVSAESRAQAKAVEIAVISRESMREMIKSLITLFKLDPKALDPESYSMVSLNGEIFFISTRTFDDGKLKDVLQEFYSGPMKNEIAPKTEQPPSKSVEL